MSEPDTGEPPRILLVDGGVARREDVASGLEARGFRVTSRDPMPSDRESAAFDLVLLGPDMTSPDLLARLWRADPLRPVVVVTSERPDRETVATLGRCRVQDIVTWDPASGDELARRLGATLERCAGRRRPTQVAAEILGGSDKIAQVRRYISMAAKSSANVLILGESGTGKELVARAIHRNGTRARAPFVAINCSAVPDGLLESELFGHEKGAFTGAVARKRGLFEQADGGTLFFDEIGEMPLAFQARLLRVLEPPPAASETTREFTRVGGEATLRADVRTLFATHRDLGGMARDGRFREDLLQRIDVVMIRVPALRERREDIPLLANVFLQRHATLEQRAACEFDDVVMELLVGHDWPLNVRELEALVRSLVVLKESGQTVILGDLPARFFGEVPAAGGASGAEGIMPRLGTLESVERAHLERVMLHVRGNKSRASRILGLSRPALDRKLARHGLLGSGTRPPSPATEDADD